MFVVVTMFVRVGVFVRVGFMFECFVNFLFFERKKKMPIAFGYPPLGDLNFLSVWKRI